MNPSSTHALAAAGVSIWLDDLSRERIVSSDLADLIATRDVVGITTNPTIFATALRDGHGYETQGAMLAADGVNAAAAIIAITTHDVMLACDAFLPVYEATNGRDGRVSIEVSPDVAHDADATLAQAIELAGRVNRPGVLVKIPATDAGLTAIEEATALGMSINVTLIFGLDRYRGVIAAYLAGLERAHASGIDLSGIRSVASFFVSRVDVEVNGRLDALGTPEAAALRSTFGVANARLAYDAFLAEFATARAQALLALGAHVQRPLWASTGVKDPTLPPTFYVDSLVAADVVNTMPRNTLEAVAARAAVPGDTITGTAGESRAVLQRAAALGIDYDDVAATLEREGIEKFLVSWAELSDSVAAALRKATQ
ncbi:MAG: transaldolase [Salinibacterium sp.]|nr:transaldolase [Salinibacterium sp.]